MSQVWISRHTDMPALGKTIVFRDLAGKDHVALVVPRRSDTIIRGAGDHVRLRTADGHEWRPSSIMVDWRYT